MDEEIKLLTNVFPLDKSATEREKLCGDCSVEIQFWESEIVKQAICDLNVAEFPVFLFSPPAIGTYSYTYQDTINSKEGLIERSWKIDWHPEYGYPSASTQETFFALLQIAKEKGFPTYLDFGSVYELIKRKGKKDPEGHYKQTLRDLHCLMSIRVIAINSFWSSDERKYKPVVDFGFFESLVAEIPRNQDELSLYRRAKKRELKLPSAVKMNDIFLASLKENNPLLLSFDSDFFYSLSPVEQRLAVLLTKYRRFSGKTEYSRNLKKLAEQIPLFAKETYNIKSFLKRSLTSLKSKGLSFFRGFSFDMDNDKEEKIIFTFTKDNEWAAKELIRNTITGRPKNLPSRKEHKVLPYRPGKEEPKKEEPPDIENMSPWLREILLRNYPSEE